MRAYTHNGMGRGVLRRGLAAALGGVLLACASHADNPIWINPMTAGTPIGTYNLGDKLSSPWYVNFEIGQTSWDYAQVGIGTDTGGSGYNWGVANWYENGDGSNKRVRRDLGNFQFTATGSWYLICQAKESSGDTYTSKSGTGWSNATTYPPADLSSAYFTVNALNNPTISSAVTNSVNPTNQVSLTWTRDATPHNVLILRKKSADSWTDPTQGAAYSQSNTIGSCTVVTGSSSATSLTDAGPLEPDTSYDYRFYSENYSYYSSGATTNGIVTLAVEPTTAPSSITYSAVTNNAMTVGWTRGNGSNVLVVCRSGSAPSADPADTSSYTADANFGGSGSSLGGGKVVYKGSDTSVAVTGLSGATAYYFAIYEFSGTNSPNYLTSNKLSGNKSTLSDEPATTPSGVGFSAVGATAMTVTWTSGSGAQDLVLMKASGAVDSAPADGMGYTANTNFTQGSQLGTGNYVVYLGGGESVTVSNLTPGVTYHVAVFTLDGSGGTENYRAASATGSQATSVARPTSAASSIVFASVTNNSLVVRWAGGDGASRIVVAKAGGAPGSAPSDNITYSANAAYGTVGTALGDGYVVYNGSGTNFTLTALSAATTYYLRIYEYNGSAGLEQYLTSSYGAGSQITLSAEPTTAASALNLYGVTKNAMTVSWLNGDGATRLVVMKQGGVVTATPADASGYTADAAFGAGSDLGGGNYVVYGGNGTNVAVTGLATNASYGIAVFEFNGSGGTENYKTDNPLSGTQSTLDNEAGIGLTPGSVNLSTMVGTAPAAQSFYVTNIGGSTLSYTLSTSDTWLAVSPASASGLPAGQGWTNNLSFNVTGLAAGVSNGTVTVTAAGATNSPQTLSVSVTLTNIPAPTACTAIGDGNELVRLAWTKAAAHDVMIVYKSGSAPSDPTGGTGYSVGAACGSGTVIYSGAGAALEHVIPAGTAAYYKFYSINNSHYSPAVSTNLTLGSYASGEVAESFAYTNTVSLSGLAGGNGFTSAWSTAGTTWTVNSGSFGSVAGYPTNAGNKVLVVPPDETPCTAARGIGTISSGRIYIAFLLNYQWSGANKWCGLSLLDGSTEKAFFGETYTADQQLGLSANGSDTGSAYGLSAGSGNDYLVIGMYAFDTRSLKVKAYYKTDTVPSSEPGSWDASTTLGAGYLTQVTGIRLGSGAGTGSGTPGNTYFDEVRVGTTWRGLLRLPVPTPSTQATSIGFGGERRTQMTVAWTNGNGDARLVVAREGSAVSGNPVDGASYTADAAYGSGTALGGGYVVYSGTGSSFTLSNLTAATTYHLRVYEFNGTGAETKYLTDTATGNPASHATLGAPSNVLASAHGTNSATRLDLSWSQWDGKNVLIVRKAGSAPSWTPSEGATYSDGQDVGGGQMVVAGSQAGTSLTDTGLLPGTDYYYAFFTENLHYYSAGIGTNRAAGMPKARNTSGGAPEQPASVYLGDTNLTFGLDSWGTIEANWGKARLAIATDADVAAGTYGAYTEYTNVNPKQVRSPQFTATGTWYWGIQMEYGFYGSGFWYCVDTNAWTDMTAAPSSALTVTVAALSNPAPVSAVTNTSNPDTKVDLAWTKWNGRNVMVVRRTGASVAWSPSQGTAYTNNQDLGSDTVILLDSSGAGTLVDTNCAPEVTYYYKFYTENYRYYSAGSEVSVTTAPPPPPVLVLGPTGLTFSVALGGTPAAQTFAVTNTGGQTLHYTNSIAYGSGSGWLTVAPVTGALAMAASQVHTASVGQVTSVGTFTATNTADGDQANGPQGVTITLAVTNLPVSTGLYADGIGTRSATVHWTRPGSYNVMVVRRQGAAPDAPANGTAYAHNATYGTDARNQVVYAAGAGSSDTDTDLYPQTVYYYAFFTENYSYYSPPDALLVVTTLTAQVDGLANEWIGTAPAAVNSSTVSSNEFIWRDKGGEQRNDSPAPANADIEEFRIRADTTNVYFYARFQDITDVGLPYLAIGVDTDRNGADSAMNWIADDSGSVLGSGYYGGSAAAHYAERNIIVHTVPGSGQRIELYADDGGAWYMPPGWTNDIVNFNATGNFIEFAVPRADLGLSGAVTGRLTVAAYYADTGSAWANGGDTTADFSAQDAQDALNVLPARTGDAAGSLSAWDEDLSDGDLDSFFDVAFSAVGIAGNAVPGIPGSLFPGDGAVVEPGAFSFNWGAATDAEDAVTGYFLEVSTNAAFQGGENYGITYRLNTGTADRYYSVETPAYTQYHWRVRSRDLSGALSGSVTNSFQIGGSDDDTSGPTPTLVYIGTGYTPGLTQTNITDADLANTNNFADIAVAWTDASGVFTTNQPPYVSTNILSGSGRVVPNWDLYTTNTVTHEEESFGYDQVFNEFIGASGSLSVTSVYHNAFAITNIDFNNHFFLTVSGEDNDNDRGAYADPQADGDSVPWDREVTTNVLVRIYVTDDDSSPPTLSGFNVENAAYTNMDLSGGLAVSGTIQDYSGVYGGSSNRYVLYRNGAVVGSGVFTTGPATNGAATSASPLGVTLPIDLVGYTGTYQLVVHTRDFDGDRVNDSLAGTNTYTFEVRPPPDYRYRMKITFNYSGGEALTNFPSLVNLSEASSAFRYAQCASPLGYDLRFSDAAGRAWLPYEVEQWNTNGASPVWVRVPELTSTGNYIWAYWGSPDEVTPPAYTTNGAVWSPDYRAVFHLHATNGTAAQDSTAYAEHGALQNMDDASWSVGQIGNALRFDGVGEYVANDVSPSWTSPFTVSFWAKDELAGLVDRAGLFSSGEGGFEIHAAAGLFGYRYAGGESASFGVWSTNWALITLSGDGASVQTYYNGIPASSVLDTRTTFSRFDLGANTNRAIFFNGLLDEVEISSVARSTNWIYTTWLNQASNATFVAFDSLQSKGTLYQIDADPADAGVALPFVESFDALPAGPLQGANDWNASPLAGAEIQTNVFFGGAASVRLLSGAAWHGVQQPVSGGAWVDWYARPARQSEEPRDIADLNWNTTAAFYINAAGHVMARSNATWVACSGTTVANGVWTRFTAHLDYTNRTWSLYVAGATPNSLATRVVDSFPFAATSRTAIVSFRVFEGNGTTGSWLDSLSIGATMPLSVDDDADGIADAWELAYQGGTNMVSSADSDADGFSNWQEFVAGTDPTNASSFMRIIGLDLESESSSNLILRVKAGGHNGGTPYTAAGDEIRRTYGIQAANNNAALAKQRVANVLDTSAGTNLWTNVNMAVSYTSRYFTVSATFGGGSYTNTEEWAAYVQPRQSNNKYLVSVPVDIESGNNLNSTLGRHLARGLHAGSSTNDADYLLVRTASNQWKYYDLLTNGMGEAVWWERYAGAADLEVTAGMGFWVQRRSSTPVTRTNCVMVGRSFTNCPALSFTTNAAANGWTWGIFGWPFSTPKGQTGGAIGSVAANPFGMEPNAYGGTAGVDEAPHSAKGDQIWIWENGNFEYYWLMDGVGANFDGRWWSDFQSQFPTVTLEPGKAYFYRHHVGTNGVTTGTNFLWAPAP